MRFYKYNWRGNRANNRTFNFSTSTLEDCRSKVDEKAGVDPFGVRYKEWTVEFYYKAGKDKNGEGEREYFLFITGSPSSPFRGRNGNVGQWIVTDLSEVEYNVLIEAEDSALEKALTPFAPYATT